MQTGRAVDEALALRRLCLWVEWRDSHHGIAPTVREFMESCGLHSTAPSAAALNLLMAFGWLGQLDHTRTPARAQYLTEDGEQALATWRAPNRMQRPGGERREAS